MIKRKLKKQNKIIRFILKILNLYAIDKDNFDLINANYENKGKNYFKFNDKSFILSNGYIELTRKINYLDIVYRYCPTIALWKAKDTWKRIVPNIDKKILIKTCLNSLKNSLIRFLEKNNQVSINLHLIKDQSDESFDQEINNLLSNDKFNCHFHNSQKKGNHGSILECCNVANKFSNDLIFFIEDDYIFEINAIDEMISTYSRIASVLKKDIFLCPSDYPFYYDSLYETSLIMGKDHRWRFVGESLLTFLLSKKLFNDYEDKIREIGLKNNHPFEKPLHEIYKKIPCFAPVGTLAHHISRNIPSVNEDWKKLWEKNLIKK